MACWDWDLVCRFAIGQSCHPAQLLKELDTVSLIIMACKEKHTIDTGQEFMERLHYPFIEVCI